MKAWKHFKTITHHRFLVMKGCFAVGLYWQGLTHDLSKYSPAEFFVGAKYYQGDRSPNNAEREAKGYSAAWLHHQGRNKHHYEYWIDYGLEGKGIMVPVEMPKEYVVEMFMDRIAACKTYHGRDYQEKDPLEYYSLGAKNLAIHPNTRALLETLLQMLADKGEAEAFSYIRREVLK